MFVCKYVREHTSDVGVEYEPEYGARRQDVDQIKRVILLLRWVCLHTYMHLGALAIGIQHPRATDFAKFHHSHGTAI